MATQGPALDRGLANDCQPPGSTREQHARHMVRDAGRQLRQPHERRSFVLQAWHHGGITGDLHDDVGPLGARSKEGQQQLLGGVLPGRR